MSTYTITSQPQEILPGWQGDTTLVNQGPSTVYIDSASSVAPLNSFPLRPYAAITWDAGQPIWVCTQSGSATLTANPAAQIVNSPGFASVDSLYTYPGNPPGFTGTPPANWWTQSAYIIDAGASGPNQGGVNIECGSYKSLVISGFMMINNASRTISDSFEILIGWASTPQPPVNGSITGFTEVDTYWVPSLNAQQSIVVPVKGKYAFLIVTTGFASPRVAAAGFTVSGSTTALDPVIGVTSTGACTVEIGGTVDSNNCQSATSSGTIYRDWQQWTGLVSNTANDMTVLIPGTVGGIVNVQANISLDGLTYGPWQNVSVHALDSYRPNTGVGGPSDLVTTTVNGTTSVSFTAAYMVPYIVQFSSSGTNMKAASYSYTLVRSQASFLSDSGWQTLAYQATFSDFDSLNWYGARYRMLNGVTYVQGLVKSSAALSANTAYPIVQLPVGTFPGAKDIMYVGTGGNSGMRLDILTTGIVEIVPDTNIPAGTYISISCSFPSN